jgi:hypothetical protein
MNEEKRLHVVLVLVRLASPWPGTWRRGVTGCDSRIEAAELTYRKVWRYWPRTWRRRATRSGRAMGHRHLPLRPSGCGARAAVYRP